MDGLHLFNDHTRPSGHISCPTQVDVSQSCFHSLNRLIKPDYIVQVWGLVEVKKCICSSMIQVRNCPGELYRMSDNSNQENPASHKNSTTQVSGIVFKNQLCSIHHGFPVRLHTPGAYDQ